MTFSLKIPSPGITICNKSNTWRSDMEKASKVTVKGQVLIPGAIRKRHHIEPGSEVRFVEYGNVVCIVPVVADPVAAAWGMLPAGPSLAEELLEERRRDKDRE
jgi:AbrB family looped-hinge helix DNA binding protein